MSILQTVLSAVLLYFVARIQLHKLRSFVPRSYPYPPSPPASWIPLVGHALQIPQQSQWKTFRKWSEQYGDVVRISVMGQQMIILDSFEAAWELLSIRGNIYSDRPKAVMAGELVGWDRGLGYAQGPPSLRFKLLRKLFNQYMGPAVYRSSPASKPDILRTQEKATKILLKRLLESPEEYARITNECSSYLFLLTIYGWDASNTLHREIIKDKGDLVDIVNIAMEGFAKASEPGAFWVDNWSIMRYIPSWFPFATFKSTAKQMRIDLDRLYDVPWGFVKGEVDRGTALPSFVRSYLTSRSEWNHNHSLANNEDSPDDEIVRAAGASIYSGGAETTPSSIQSFILAMLLYSDIQKRAQSELDRYFNSLDMNLRLPESSDRPSLPYVSAIVKEVWRWGCAVPLGLAHVVTQDDVYREMHIDQGSVVWANIWSMLNNPSVFPSPEKFDPSRFLEVTESGGLAMRQLDKKEDPSEIAFGFGRRVCPGLHLAEHSLFLTIASILYTFDILPHDSEPGIPEWVGFISFPKQFCCRIVPRSEAKRDLVESLSKGPNC